MCEIRTALQQRADDYNNKLMRAACCTAFLGFLGCSKFTVPSQKEYDPDSHLSLADISFDSRIESSMVRIHIKQSKTDPFQQGVYLCLDNIACPINSTLFFLTVRKGFPCPLFIMENGQF